MIWILGSIAIILGVWFTKLPIKYKILEKTNELGETYYYPQHGLLFWNNFDEFRGYNTLTNICFNSYDEAKEYIYNK